MEFGVQCHLARCPAALSERGIVAFNYATGLTVDADGYLTLTRRGSIEIAMTRQQNSRRLPDHVDRVRDLTRPDAPLGFQRTGHDWSPDLSKRRATFSYTLQSS